MNRPISPELVQLVDALGPYRAQLVLAGAWAQRLFVLHPLATDPGFELLGTKDADLAIPLKLPVEGESLAERLKKAGFHEELTGDGYEAPASAYYLHKGEPDEFHAEFIAPLFGSGYTRKHEPDFVAKTAGVTAQKLRWVDLLLLEPWTATVGAHGLKVANPVSYIAQKLLSIPKRALTMLDKQAKDLLYVHDTLVLFGAHLDELRPLADKVLRALAPAHEKDLHEYCASLYGPGLRAGAARIAEKSGRPAAPTAARIETVCRTGLEILFGRE